MSKFPTFKELFKNTSIFGGSQVITLLAAVVRSKVAAEYVGALGIGLNSLYNAVATVASTSANFGISMSAIKMLSEEYEKSGAEGRSVELEVAIAKVRKLGMLFATIGAVVLLSVSPVLSKMYFEDFSQLFQFMSLALAVWGMVVSGIELSIMRATRHLRSIVFTSIIGALLSVAVVSPVYMIMGSEGVIWAFVACSVLAALVIMVEGFRVNRWTNVEIGIYKLLVEMKGVLILGLSFGASGFAASAIDLLVQSYFNIYASLDVLGMYRAGFQISVTYIGMVFAAIGNDYFPRLAAVSEKVAERNRLISLQIKVLLSVTIPVVLVFGIVAPYVIHILYNNDFDPIVGMVRYAAVGIIAKGVYLPLEFVLLAKGKSVQFLIMEIINNVLIGVCTIVGYELGGYTGIGVGILASQVIETIWVAIFLRKAHDVRVSLMGS